MQTNAQRFKGGYFMTNKELLEKLQYDMEMRGFSHYTKESYLYKAKEIVEYFKKPMEEVTTKELREFLMKYIREEKKISERSSKFKSRRYR